MRLQRGQNHTRWDVVSGLCDHEDVSTLSLKQFYAEFARKGGYLFPQNCPRPGWQCLWHGLDRRSKRLRQKYFANVLEVKKTSSRTRLMMTGI